MTVNLNQTQRVIKPQAGPQTAFLSCTADIAIMGGAAGVGKTFSMLLEYSRWLHKKGFVGIIFRRNGTDLKDGGIWTESHTLYRSLGAIPNETSLSWKVKGGGLVKMSHLQYENDVFSHQGKQYALIGFEELTHFTATQFWYMLTRNRSVCGVRPYMRATCNPDPDSFVAKLIEWWINQDTGIAIPERSGVIRYFYRYDDELYWSDTRQELVERFNAEPVDVKSFTFISGSIYDNKILLKNDPGYLGNLKAQDRVTRARLLEGNWKIKPASGLYFQRGYFKFVDKPTRKIVRIVRAWDLAATEVDESKDPDWTSATKWGLYEDGGFVILDSFRGRWSALKVREMIRTTADVDGRACHIFIPQDPGQAGKDQAQQITKMLAGYVVKSERMTGDKVTRASGYSAQAEAGNIEVIRGAWNDTFMSEHENFPPQPGKGHDDQVDSASDGFNYLAKPTRRMIIG